MFTTTFDEATATLVCRYTTPYDPGDYPGYHAEFVRMVAAARSRRRHAVLILDIQDGYPQPNAVQRKAIADAWAKAQDVDAAIAMLTGSTLFRGIITAIEWFLKDSASRRETRAFARVSDDLRRWMAKEHNINFMARPLSDEHYATAWSPSTFARLAEIRERYDPARVLNQHSGY